MRVCNGGVVFPAADAAAAAAAAYAAAAAAYADDCLTLKAGAALRQVATSPLWPALRPEIIEAFAGALPDAEKSGGEPAVLRERGQEFSALLHRTGDFGVWAEFIEGMRSGEREGRWLFGLKTSTTLELLDEVALLDDDLWQDPPALNARFKAMVEAARGGGDIPTIPPMVPAALEPVWEDGKLVLPREPAEAETNPDNLQGAFEAIRAELRELAENIEGEANIDRRVISYFQRVADRVPATIPTNFELHRIASQEKVLEDYGRTVSAEWPELLAARYHALFLQFGRCMDQFPDWREFKRNANTSKLSKEQVAIVPVLVAAFNEALRTPEIAAFVEGQIPEKLEILAEPQTNIIDEGNELLAADVLASMDWILKRLAEAGLAALQTLGGIGKKAWDNFAGRAEKSIVEEAGKAGDKVGPAIKKLFKLGLYGGSAGLGGKALFPWLATNYPNLYSWIEPIARLFV